MRARTKQAVGRESFSLASCGRGSRWRRPLLFLLLGALLGTWFTPQLGAAEVSKELRIKAAFLYNFTKFVEWPAGRFESEEAPLLIGVLGADAFRGVLEETVRGRSVDGRPVQVVRLTGAAELGRVHMVFIGEGAEDCRVAFAQAPEASVLTVGECDGPEGGGAAINFRTVGDKIRFEINIAAAEARGMKLSAHLQKLATAVYRKP